MSRKIITLIIAVTFLSLGFAMISYANVPPPPVNQNAGIDDGIFNNLIAAECRICHDQGGGPVDGICTVTGGACTVDPDNAQGNCPDPSDECLAILTKNRHHLCRR
jgi:hypothetical protein